MEAATYGLLGTLAGGAITVVVAFIAFWKEYTLWKTQFRTQSLRQDKQQLLERYAKFLGAYYYIEGVLGDIEDILSQAPENLSKRLSDVVSEPDYENAAISLNNEKGWVALLTADPAVVEKITNLEKMHDNLFEVLSKAKDGTLGADDAFNKFRTLLKDLKTLGAEVRNALHAEVAGA